jgi:hypothetical protein
VTPCNLIEVYKCFGGIYYIRLEAEGWELRHSFSYLDYAVRQVPKCRSLDATTGEAQISHRQLITFRTFKVLLQCQECWTEEHLILIISTSNRSELPQYYLTSSPSERTNSHLRLCIHIEALLFPRNCRHIGGVQPSLAGLGEQSAQLTSAWVLPVCNAASWSVRRIVHCVGLRRQCFPVGQ